MKYKEQQMKTIGDLVKALTDIGVDEVKVNSDREIEIRAHERDGCMTEHAFTTYKINRELDAFWKIKYFVLLGKTKGENY